VRWRGSGADWARQHELLARDLHISYTHDGDAHLTLLAQAPGLRGVGIDVVHLPRLFRASKSSDYAARFARHFMSAVEYTGYCTAAQNEPNTERLRRAAAHFSLMEAASKALGTGLRIGGGMGHPTSLLKTELGVSCLTPRVEWILGDEARRRCVALGATTLEGYWSADDAYLVSVALLWNRSVKHEAAPMQGRVDRI
jgi:phosphopantetheine--protein transferase-like protein